MISIVDYGVGNIASLANMFDFLGVGSELASTPEEIARAEKLVLPGVGAFDKAMATLAGRGLAEPVRAFAGQGRPLLGVCLGLQLLGGGSEEGLLPGLGLIDASAVRLAPSPKSGLKVPNIGWCEVAPAPGAALFPPSDQPERFYFVHSYHLQCRDRADVAATIDYDGEITVAIARGNIHGVQFHPEKSHRFGMRLLKAFASL
jgi:glutamine amidotransferase